MFNMVATVGTLLKIHPMTISWYQVLYARVLVDVNIAKRLPKRILTSLKSQKKDINANFFVTFYEKLPSFCIVCNSIEHVELDYQKQIGNIIFLGRRGMEPVTRREVNVRPNTGHHDSGTRSTMAHTVNQVRNIDINSVDNTNVEKRPVA